MTRTCDEWDERKQRRGGEGNWNFEIGYEWVVESEEKNGLRP